LHVLLLLVSKMRMVMEIVVLLMRQHRRNLHWVTRLPLLLLKFWPAEGL
jgi:hypothetical protein